VTRSSPKPSRHFPQHVPRCSSIPLTSRPRSTLTLPVMQRSGTSRGPNTQRQYGTATPLELDWTPLHLSSFARWCAPPHQHPHRPPPILHYPSSSSSARLTILALACVAASPLRCLPALCLSREAEDGRRLWSSSRPREEGESERSLQEKRQGVSAKTPHSY
jgi:hypothetical protein